MRLCATYSVHWLPLFRSRRCVTVSFYETSSGHEVAVKTSLELIHVSSWLASGHSSRSTPHGFRALSLSHGSTDHRPSQNLKGLRAGTQTIICLAIPLTFRTQQIHSPEIQGEEKSLHAGHMAVGQNPVPLVNIRIGGKWMFIHPKMGSP